MEFKKNVKPFFEYENEVYALQTLQGTGIAPQIIKCDENSYCIIMEKITIPPLDLNAIYDAGDVEILNYAKAEYYVRSILDEKGVSYWGWKNEHQFYDRVSGKLMIVDFGGDCSKKKPRTLKERLDNDFSFINDIHYTKNDRYICYKKELSNKSFYFAL